MLIVRAKLLQAVEDRATSIEDTVISQQELVLKPIKVDLGLVLKTS